MKTISKIRNWTFLLFFFLLLNQSCSTSEEVIPLQDNDDFYKVLALTDNIYINADIMRNSGMEISLIDNMLKDKLKMHNSIFSKLKMLYPNLEEDAVKVLENNDMVNERIALFSFSFYDPSTKGFTSNRTDFIDPNECGDGCAGYEVGGRSCINGCKFSQAACLDSGVSIETCGQINSTCKNDCCGAYC